MAMIIVELKRIPEDSQTYETAATLTVDADGSFQLEDPLELFPTRLHVLVPGDDGVRKVEFHDDPEAWARHLSGLMRAGHLVPVITHDDNQHSGGPAGRA